VKKQPPPLTKIYADHVATLHGTDEQFGRQALRAVNVS